MYTPLVRRVLRLSALGYAFVFGISSLALAQTIFEELEIVRPLPTPNHITSLHYGNGIFLATVERGQVLSSSDGVSWSGHDVGYSGSMSDIAFGNGLYVATSAGSGPVFVSSDLETWTQVLGSDVPPNNDNVSFHDGLFYFGGAQFGDGAIATTADCVSFTRLPTPGTNTVRDIGYGGGLFVAVGDDLEVMTSADGVSWTVRPTGSTIEGLGQDLLNVRYLNSQFIVGGKSGTILTSSDGISWTERAFSEDSSWFYSSDFEGSTYYFTGRNGILWSTTDWTSWSAVDSGGSSDVYGFEREEGLTVLVGRDGMIRTSPDRSVWTDRKDGFPSNFSDLAYGADVFVASDYDGNLFKTANGKDWTQVFAPGVDLQWETIVFADGKFVAMTQKGEWSLSGDGTIWSQPSEGFGSFVGIRNLLYANERWYVCGRDGFLRSSSNLSNWEVHDFTSTAAFVDVAYGDSVFVAVGSEGAIFSSSNGSDWVERSSGVTSSLYSVEYGNGRFVVVGQSSVALTSVDGVTWTADGQQNQPFSVQNLEFRDGQFIAMDTYGRIGLSSDGIVWSSVYSPSTQAITATAANDEILVAVGFGGIVLTGDLPPKKNLSISVVGEGSVTVSPEGSPYPHLADVVLTAIAGNDYAFSGWSGGASGNANPLVLSMDSDKDVTATFVLSVSGYALWRYVEFSESERADAEATAAAGDFDKDGLSNLGEYLLGFDPTVANPDVGVQLGLVEIDSYSYLTISYKRSSGQSDGGQRVEVSGDFDGWNSGVGYTEQTSLTDNGDGTETVVVRALGPISEADRVLMRLALSE